MQLTSRKNRWMIALPGLLAAALLTAACGSDSSGGDSAGGKVDQTQAAADTKAAQAIVDTLLKPATAITQTEKLAAAPAKGTMIWMNCDVPACQVIGDGVKAGVEAAGWTFDTETYQSADPATLTAALKRALDKNPTAVSLSGIPPEAGWSAVIPDYEAAGVPIVTTFLGPTKLNDTVIVNAGGPPARYADGVNMAHWFIADSKGQGRALLQRLDGFPILKEWADGFETTVKDECAGCSLETLSNTIADGTGGKIVSTIIPALRKDDSLKYLVSADLEFLDALPAQMDAAGLKDTIVIGATPTVTGQQAILDGTWAAATPAPFAMAGWVAADAAFRYAAGVPVPDADNGPLPTQLLTPDGDWTVNPTYDQPADYPEQFKTLWNVG